MKFNKYSVIDELFEMSIWIIFGILWIIISLMVMFIYQYLAGDKASAISNLNPFIGTPIAIVLFITAIAIKLSKNPFSSRFENAYKKMAKNLSFFSIWMFLPILMNTFSTIVKMLGSTKHADYLYNLRYHSLWLSVLLIVTVTSLYHLKKPA
ncbi:MAG: hypothetical protein WC842_03755 [Candidatus Paceibacterota bacterium]|jgi:hypothetical protein